MSTKRDYYEVLSVDRDVDADELKRVYRRLAMKHHPDRNPGDAEAEAKFKEAAEAYETLSDPDRRARYDRFGHEGLRGGAGGPAGHDFSRMRAEDIFSMFNDIFGGGGGGGRSRGAKRAAPRGYDLETEVVVSLHDVLNGADREVSFTRLDVCQKCDGSGAKEGAQPETCPTCNGQGRVMQAGLGGMFRIATTCPTCDGRGTVIKDPCPACKGKGRVPTKRSLTVQIPAGVHDGQAVRLRGEGEPPPQEVSPDGSGHRGDLHVVVRVQPHETLHRDGDDLILEMPIGFAQAALGAELLVPTLEEPASLTVPPGTQHGDVFRVKGLGLASLRHPDRRGDLHVAVRVEIPKKLTDKQEKLLREYAQAEDTSVLPESHGLWEKIKGAFI